jgi:HPr kinase/phosphorylase
MSAWVRARSSGVEIAAPAEQADDRRERAFRDNDGGGPMRDKACLHGVLIEVCRLGILLTGESGCSKSTIALELIGRGHRLIADDCVEVVRLTDSAVEGTCPGNLGDFLAIRHLGILNVRRLFGAAVVCERKSIDLIIKLTRSASERSEPETHLRGARDSYPILGVAIPRLELPAIPGYNLALLVECAARDHRLRLSGYRADEDFTRRLQKIMAKDSPCG